MVALLRSKAVGGTIPGLLRTGRKEELQGLEGKGGTRSVCLLNYRRSYLDKFSTQWTRGNADHGVIAYEAL